METDEPLLHVLQRSGSIELFLDSVFGFLHRSTDFYHVTPNPAKDGVGFKPGIAVKLVQRAFYHYENLGGKNPTPDKANCTEKATDMPLTSRSRCIAGTSGNDQCIASSNQIHLSDNGMANGMRDGGRVINEESVMCAVDGSDGVEACADGNVGHEETCVSSLPPPRGFDVESSDNVEGDVELGGSIGSGDCYNGAINGNYTWSQTVEDVDLKIKLPADISSSGLLDVHICATSLSLRRKLSDDVIFEGKLFAKIAPSATFWNFSSKDRTLNVAIQKLQPNWWKKLFEEENELDMQKLDTTVNLFDLPQDEQATIDQLRYDQIRKAQGLPTVKEEQTEEMLRRAWHIQGSPFAGQPFDPSVVKFS